MKPIRGSVVSSKSVSLSKAAAILSRFAASETGAPQEVSAFLRRTSEAFGELVKFRRDLRAGQERPSFRGVEEVESTRRKKKKKKKKKEEAGVEAARDQVLAEIDGNPGTSSGFQRGVAPGILDLTEIEGGSREKRKKKRRVAEGIEGGVGNAVEVEVEKSDGGEGKRKDTVEDVKERAWGEENVENHRERSQNKKKRKKEEDLKEGNGDAVENYVERHHKKKRKVKQES